MGRPTLSYERAAPSVNQCDRRQDAAGLGASTVVRSIVSTVTGAMAVANCRRLATSTASAAARGSLRRRARRSVAQASSYAPPINWSSV